MELNAVEDLENQRPRRKLSDEHKKAIRFAVVTLVLLLANFAYLFAGMYLFYALESPNDESSCLSAEKDYNDSRNASLQLMMDLATTLDKFAALKPSEQQGVAMQYRDILRNFGSTVLSANHNPSKPCSLMNSDPNKHEKSWDSRWSKGNALMYALTIITTIGYGYTCPLTTWGRYATILYGVIGIPLLMACQINFGVILAKIFRAVYGALCCCGLCHRKPEKIGKNKATAAGQQAVFRTDASGKPLVEDQSAAAAAAGLASDSGDGGAEAAKEEDEEEEDTLTVPLFISLLVLITTLLSGMAIFMNVEEFEPVPAIYYTFISLSTIGFGDFTPQKSFAISGGGSEAWMRCIGCTLFIFVGIAMLSMCFQLINDEVTAKLEYLSAKAAAMKKKKEEQRAATAAAAAAAAAAATK